MNTYCRFALVFIVSSLVFGCVSDAGGRARLLRVYPLHHTTRAVVAEKWAPLRAEVSRDKPASGWLALDSIEIGRRADAIEKKLSEEVALVDRYFGSYGLGLCRCWFYFDRTGRLIDVEWQRVSD
jgi:hypothetical protein